MSQHMIFAPFFSQLFFPSKRIFNSRLEFHDGTLKIKKKICVLLTLRILLLFGLHAWRRLRRFSISFDLERLES